VRNRLLVLVLLAGCTGEITSADEGFGPTAPPPPGPDAGTPTPAFSLRIVEPEAGAELPRDVLLADGTWGARVRFAATPSTPAATVEWVGLGSGGPPDYAVTAALLEDGERSVEAIARDAAGRELGRSRVPLRVMPPTAGESCLDKLDSLGVEYAAGPSAQGVARPVTIRPPLNGLSFMNSSGAVRQSVFMDCELALSLWRTAELWKARGVTTIVDYGIYNYRCIDQSVRPPCAGTSFSQHAFAMAIDIAVLITGDGTRYVVDDDWIIEDPPAGEDTCSVTPAAGAKNALLHEALCELHDLEVFKILLTPNYNAAHRNHFHVDLTPQQGSWVGKQPAGAHLDSGPLDE
jgi:hypothetical protein